MAGSTAEMPTFNDSTTPSDDVRGTYSPTAKKKKKKEATY